jgi:hypothetical protein
MISPTDEVQAAYLGARSDRSLNRRGADYLCGLFMGGEEQFRKPSVASIGVLRKASAGMPLLALRPFFFQPA